MSRSHSRQNQYRGTCKPNDPCCYVFLRYSLSRYQNCINSLVKQMSVSSSYTGQVVGVTKDIECLEGEWPSDKGLAIMRFECACEAERWIQCTPDVKQHDWIDGDIDILTVSVRDLPAKDKVWYELIDITHIDNYDHFCNQYVEKVNPYLSKLGGTAATGVVAVSSPHAGNGPKSLRGRWQPHTLIVNQFSSREAFMNAYCAEEYQPLKCLRQQVCHANVILFKLMPLIHKHC